jgi:predicted nucleic acid-binding protein
MNKVLFDANVILDVWLKRDNLYETSLKAVAKAAKMEVVGFIPVTSIPVIFYRTEKQNGKKEAENLLRSLMSFIGVAAADEKTVSDALNAGFDDFEDALVYAIAVNNKMECIVTRDKKGFVKAKEVDVHTPDEFIKLIR